MANSGEADDGIHALVMVMDSIDNGTTSGGLGMAASTDDTTYRFSEEPAAVSFALERESFSSTEPFDFVLGATLASGDFISIPVREGHIEGTFTTEKRCSIGEEVLKEPFPEWKPGGTMTGLVTVDDARNITVAYQSHTFSLCGYLAYGLAVGLRDDPHCEVDPSDWDFPPDATTETGDPAWVTSADFAATAVWIEESASSH